MPRFVLLRALNGALFSRILLCCVVLTALLEVLALLEQAMTILDRNLGIKGVLYYSLLHFPALATEIMPLSVLLGALFVLLRMTLSSEVAIIRAAGLSTWNLYRLFLPAIALISLLTMVAQFWIVPPCEQALTVWWNKTTPLTPQKSLSDLPSLWFRSGSTLIRIDHISHGGTRLHKVYVYRRDPQTGLLVSTDYASQLDYTGQNWHASDAVRMTLDTEKDFANLRPEPGRFFPPVTPRQIMALTQPGAFFTPGEILRILYRSAPASLPRATYTMSVLSGLFLPLQLAVMLLIAFPVTYIPPRAGLRTPLPIYVIAAGLGVVILQGMISALGNAGTIPALLATSSAPVAAALLGIGWILRMEER